MKKQFRLSEVTLSSNIPLLNVSATFSRLPAEEYNYVNLT